MFGEGFIEYFRLNLSLTCAIRSDDLDKLIYWFDAAE